MNYSIQLLSEILAIYGNFPANMSSLPEYGHKWANSLKIIISNLLQKAAGKFLKNTGDIFRKINLKKTELRKSRFYRLYRLYHVFIGFINDIYLWPNISSKPPKVLAVTW